ncbi:glycosyltransferase [bacterium]|nr:glycosyltransferase [bacterium]
MEKIMTEYCFLTSIYRNTKVNEMKLCVDSMINQTIAPSQIVVVVDGPIDGSLEEYIKELEANELFTVLRLDSNVGLGKALKFGMEVCRYEIVARMDTDDICVLDRMEKQLKVLEDLSISIVGSNIAEFIGTKDNVVSVRDVPSTHDEIVTYMKKRCPFNHMAVTFRKSEVLKAGGYMHWHYDEDSYLWVRMYLAGCRFANIEENLVFARIDQDTFRRRGGKKYYLSEKALFKFMLDNKIISKKEYFIAVTMRFVIQVVLPNRLRGWLFINFMRKKQK